MDAVPEEDSADFTQEEADRAIPTPSTAGIVHVLKSLSCAFCGAHTDPTKYSLRRLGGHLFWRIQISCSNKHEGTIILQTDWMRGV